MSQSGTSNSSNGSLPMHYWRIHARVSKRILLDTPERIRHIIAHDAAHETSEYQWFEKKAREDSMRLFLDESYYDNQPFSFRVPKRERV